VRSIDADGSTSCGAEPGGFRIAADPRQGNHRAVFVLASAAIEVAARLVGDLVVADERAYAVRSL